MNSEYYSERQGIIRARDQEVIGRDFWGAFVVTIEKITNEGFFAEAFPEKCPDGRGLVAGGSSYARDLLLKAEVGQSGLTPATPDTLIALDVIEFFAKRASKPSSYSDHSYWGHRDVWDFSRTSGRSEYRETINRLLSRCGHPYELDTDGQIHHVGAPAFRELLASTNFHTGDAELDRLLKTAVEKFRDPNPLVRAESLEKLWDAWERLKTLLPGDKKQSTTDLLAAAVPEPKLRGEVTSEALALTAIGNNFMIRHAETDKVKIDQDVHVEYLFHRLYSLMYMLLKGTGRASA